MDYCNCDLPGYYYDASRQKYFRVYPGFHPPDPLPTPPSPNDVTPGNEIGKKARTANDNWDLRRSWCRKSSNRDATTPLVDLLKGRELGDCTGGLARASGVRFRREIVAAKLKNLPENISEDETTLRVSREAFSASHGSLPGLLDCVQLLPSKDTNRVFGFWRDETPFHLRSKMFAGIFEAWGPDPRSPAKPFSLSQRIQFCCHEIGLVTDACWAEFPDGQQNVMACIVSDGAQVRNFCFLFKDRHRVQKLMSEKCAVFSCAFDSVRQRYAIGLETHGCFGQLSDPDRTTPLFSDRSSIFGMKFLYDDGNVLLSALRNGYLYCTDLRDRPSSRYAYRMAVGKRCPMTRLEVLRNDENCVLASGYDHKLVRIDLRSRRVVKQYEEHRNKDSSIPFYVDEEADVLCSMGDDSLARLWRLTSGQLIVNVPPPALVDKSVMPTYCFKMKWGDFGNCPAVIWACKSNRNFVSHV